jgi:cytochrome c peroxidase
MLVAALALLNLFCVTAESADLKSRLNTLLNTPLLGLPKYEAPVLPSLSSASLGRLLFYDKRLSKDATVSCASCHDATSAFSNTTAVSTGIGEMKGTRKAQPILNRAFGEFFFWDGRAKTLEEQALQPILNPIEMGNTEENLLHTLQSIRGYEPLFHDAFGSSPISVRNAMIAISDFERTLQSGNSKFDKWQNDPHSVAYTAEEVRGYEIFNDRECHICHSPPLFTDQKFHNSGVSFVNGNFPDEGRYAYTKTIGADKPDDIGSFKTPTLRNLLTHAPYMHDGSLKTLEEVVTFYNKGGNKNPHISPDVLPLGLRPNDKAALIAFLKTLEGEGYEETPPLPSEFPQ